MEVLIICIDARVLVLRTEKYNPNSQRHNYEQNITENK